MADATLQLIPLEQVKPHPEHPRLVLREDVISAIVANLSEDYPQKYAVHVRPFGDTFQLLSGHLRAAAARRKGLATIWGWVEAVDDDEAFMQLVVANSQSELSPLEIGMHALKTVPKAEGGRGKAGGLSAYAKRLGCDESYIRQLYKAAEVVAETPDLSPRFLNHAKHLAAVHRVHPSLWTVLVPLILEKGWAGRETEHVAAKVAEIFDHDFVATSSPWWGVFLPTDKVASELATDADFTATQVKTLAASADATVAMVAEYRARGVETNAHEQRWRAWLKDNVGGDAWSVRRLDQRREEMRNELEGQLPRDGWHRGDWRDYVDELKDGSVSAVVTDPPFGMNYACRADRHGPIANDGTPAVAAAELAEFLRRITPKLKPRAHLFVFCGWGCVAAFESVLADAGFRVRSHAVWAKNNHGPGDLGALAPMHELILHATIGDATLYHRHPDVFAFAKVDTGRHPTEKPQALLERMIEISTVRGDLIVDPFGGVASTAAAARAVGRGYWSCELEEGYWRAGEHRLELPGQPPIADAPSSLIPHTEECPLRLETPATP